MMFELKFKKIEHMAKSNKKSAGEKPPMKDEKEILAGDKNATSESIRTEISALAAIKNRQTFKLL